MKKGQIVNRIKELDPERKIDLSATKADLEDILTDLEEREAIRVEGQSPEEKAAEVKAKETKPEPKQGEGEATSDKAEKKSRLERAKAAKAQFQAQMI